MCDCFHLAFPNWHAASSGTGGRRLRGPEAATEDDSVSDSTRDEPARFTEGERPRPQGSSPVEEFPETEKYTDSDKECEGEHDRQNKTGSGKKTKKSGLGSMFEKRSTPKMNKLKELPIPESAVIVKTAKDGCAEGLVYGGGGRDGIFIKGVVPESPASKSLKLKEGDQILSATVYFDNVSYEDAIQILEHAQAYKMKLCLKRKPDISQTDAPNQSDVIPEDDVYAPEMREQGKTKRHGDARISWPKFPSFGKGRKAHFKRSHSSSEAEEQRKLELSPTTSDTESPIKSQDALKGRKKNKMKLSVLTKRGRISSSEDQDTITTGQISSDVQHTQESDMLSPECLESPSGDAPKVYVSKDEKSVGDLRPEQNNQTLTESGTPGWKAELISIDSTLKTTDLTVALANQDSQTGVKSPEGKKKTKKEKSELKLKILGKDQSHKKAKSSPKRLKTLGASLEVSDQNDAKKSDVAQIESTKTDLRKPKVELDSSDVDSKQKGKEKTQKSKQKQAKPGAIIKLPQVGLGDATSEEKIQQVSVNVEEYKPKTELLTASGAEVKVHSYDKLLKDRISSTQLPKREDIEIPGMEDKSAKTKVKGVKESKRHHEETVQMSIDVDSVKEAVSKLPGYKLPKVDTSGMPIPEEIIVIDANAQRISVKTPTKIVDTKTKHETHFTKFDATARQDSSKTTIKLPKMRAADLTTQELLFETRLDAKKPQKQHEEIKTGAYEREDIIIPGRETTHSFDRTSDGIKGEKTIYLQDIKISETETMTDQGWIGGFVSDVKIPEIDGIEFIDSTEGSPAKKDAGVGLLSFDVNLDAKLKSDASIPEITGEIKDVKAIEHTVQMPKCGELTTDISVNAPGGDINMDRSEMESLDSEGKRGKFKMPSFGISFSKKKEPQTGLSPSKKDATVTLPEAKVSLPEQKIDAEKPQVDIKQPQIEGELDVQGNKFKMPQFESPTENTEAKVKLPKAPEVALTLGSVDVSIPEHKSNVEKTAMETKPLKIEGELDPEGTKFKLPKLGITMAKVKGPELDLSASKKGADVMLQEAKGKIHAPEAELKAKVEITAPEIKVAEKDAKGSPLKFKMPTFKLPKFEVGAPNISAGKPDVNTEATDIKIPKKGLQVNIAAPSIDVVGLSIDIKENEVEGKGDKFKIPSLGFSKPKGKGPKLDLNLSKKEVDVTLPKTDQVEKGVSLPDVKMKMPQAEVKLPEMNLGVKAPEFEAESDGHEGKFKKTKFGIKLPEVKGPEFDFSISKGEVDVKLPETQDKLPEVDPGTINVSLPDSTIEVNKPELEMQPLEIEGQQGAKFKMPSFGIKMPKVKGLEIDMSQSKKDPGVKTSQSDVTVGKVEFEEQESKLKMPKFGVSMPKVKRPDIHLGLSKKDAEVTAPEVKADVKLEALSAQIEMKAPQIDTVATSSQFTMPDISFSTQKIKGTDVHFTLPKTNADVKLPEMEAEAKLPEAPEIYVKLGSIDVSLPDAQMKLEKPELDVKMTGCEGEGKESKFKVPKFGISLPKVQGPEIDFNLSKRDVKLPEAKVDVKLPKASGVDTDLGNVVVSIPQTKSEIKQPELEIKPLEVEGELEGSKFKVPKFGIKMPEIKGPKFDVSMSKKVVKLPEAEVKLPEAPEIDVRLGSVDVSLPDAKMKLEKPELEIKPLKTEAELDGQGTKFKMPKFGVTMAKVKGPDVYVTLPEVKGEIKLPDVEVKKPSAEVEIKSPEIKLETKDTDGSPSKFKMPTFKMPKFGGGSPSVSVDVPDVDKDIKLEGADIKIPEEVLTVNIEAPNIKSKGPTFDIKMTESEPEKRGSKFKFPSLGFKGPEIDLSVSKKDVDVKLPGVKAEVKLPDVEVKKPSAEVEIKSPGIDLKTSDVEGSPSKIKLPTFKFPKFGVGGPHVSVEGPDMDKDMTLEGADLKIKGAKAEVKLPDVEVKEPAGSISIPQVPEVDADAKSRKTSWTMPRFSFSKASVKAPEAEINLEAPKLDVSIPEGTVEVKQPEGDVQLDGQKGKFKFPSLGFKGPEIDLSVSKKDVDVKLPGVKAEVKLPDVEVKKPSAEVEIKSPEIKLETKDTDGSPSKFKMPTFKMPKFGGGSPSVSVDVPDVDKDIKLEGADIKIPEEVLTVNIEAPNIKSKGPTFDIKMTESEPEKRGSKFKFPSLGFKGPEIDLSVSKKDVDVKLPGVKAEVKLPDVEVKKPSTEVEIKSPGIDLKTSDVEGSPSKIKLPTFKFPKFGVGGPHVSVEGPDMDKDMTLEGADLKIKGAKAEVKLPDVEVKEPAGSISIPQVPEVDADAKSRKTSWTMPRFSFSKASVKAPEAEINLEAPKLDVSIPEGTVEVKQPEGDVQLDGQKGKFKFPSLGFKGPEIDLSVSKKDVDVKLPGVKAEVKLPDVEVKKPSAEVEIKSPGIDLKTSDVEGSPSKIKLPTFKFPKFGVGGPHVSVEGPDMDKDMTLEGADLKIKGAKAEVKLPDVEVKEPAGSISIPQVPEVDADAKSRKTSWTMPRFSFSKASVKAPEAEINLEAPKLDVSIPEGTVEVKQPEGDVQLDGQKGKFKFPSLGFKGPEIDLSVSKKDVDVKLPGVKAEVKLPDVEVKKPSAEVEIKSPEIKLETKDTDGSPSKFKMPTFKMPKFGGGSPSVSVDVPDVDKDIKLEGADIKIPEEVLTVNIEAPNIKTKGPTFDIKMTESEPEKRGSKFKFPSLGFKGPEIDLSVSKKDVDVKLPGVKAEVKLPDVEVKKPSTEVEIKSPGIDLKTSDVEGSPSKIKLPTFKFPKFGVGGPHVSVEGPDMDKDMTLEGADLKIKGAKAEVKLPDVEVKEPAGSISIPQVPEVDADAKSRKTSWTMPRFSFSKASVKAPEAEINLEAPKLDVSIPEGTVEVKQPEGDVQLDGQKGKFKFPSLGFKGPEIDLSVSKKDVDVKLPGVKAEVKLPDVEVKKPSAEVEIKSPEIKLETKDTDGSPSKFKMPTFKMPKFGGGSPSVSVDVPDVDKDIKLEGADIKIPEEVLTVNIEAPNIKSKGPTFDIKMTESEPEKRGSKFKFPSLGFKGPEIDLSVSKKDVDVKLPGVKAEVKLPDVEVKKPSTEVEIKSPGIDLKTSDVEGSPSKIKLPTFKFPKFGVGGPHVSVEGPDMDKDMTLEGADLKIKGAKAEVKLPDVEVKEPAGSISIPQVPEVDADAKSRKTSWTMPRFSFSKASVKAPEAEINLEAPKLDVSIPEGTVEVKQPEGDVQLDGQKGKFKFPSLGFKGPEIDLSVSKKDVDVKLPGVKAEVKLPDVEVKKPSAEVEIKSPGIDLKTSDVEGSPSKIKLPTFKFPKFGVGGPHVSVEGPDMDKDMTLEGADLKIKGAKAEVKLPDVEVKEPAGSISIPQVPEVDADAKSRKTSWTMPRFSFSKASVKAPEAEINLEAPKLDVSIPEGTVEVKQPEGDVQLDGQKGKFKFPSLGFKGPEIDLSVSKKDVDVKLPGVKAEVKLPDVEVKKPSAEVEIKSPEIKLETKDTDGSPSKFKMPTFKMPKFGGGSPSVSVDVPDVDKDIKLEGADIKIPEEVLTVNIEAPNIKTKGPTFDIKMTESEGSGGKFKLPSFGISAPKVKGPEIDLRLSKKDVTLPEVSAEVQLPDNEVKDNDAADSEAKARRPGWTFSKHSFSKSSGKVSDADFNLETPKVNVAASDAKAVVLLPDVEVKQSAMKVEVRAPEIKIKSAEIGVEKLKISQKDVNITLPELKLSEGEVKGIEAKSKDVGRSPLKFKMPTMTMLKLGGATQDSTTETPSAEQVAQIEDIKLQQDMTVTLKCPSVDIKTDASKAATSGSETPKDEPDSVELGSPSKFKLPSFKMPRLSFSRTKSEEENIPANTKHREHEEEVKVETKEVKLSSFGNIFKTIDVEFDVPNAEKVEDKVESSKEAKKHDEAPGQQVDQEVTKSPERTGWFSFRFGLSSPSEAPKASQENERSPAGETGDDDVSPSCSVQSSDAFADVSSTVTSELIGPSISSPTKVTVKYSDPDSAVGPGDIQSNIITSTARTELISDMPNLPEKITILSSGVSSSSEDTLRLESGKIHVFTSNIQATPESQHARLLTAVQVQPSSSVSLTSEAKEASSWTMQDTQDGVKTVFERRLVKETSSERSESTETIVITKQISHVFQSSEPISGETASSIQRLRDTVHSDKMKFFDETEK